jgi:ATP-dependent HslUV protease ATP-binding subunit HslU
LEAKIMEIVSLTPQETVAELDKYIVGQAGAKKAVAISLRKIE